MTSDSANDPRDVGRTSDAHVGDLGPARQLAGSGSDPGSVGQPRDGDPRASYAVIEDGDVQLRRAAYDIERTVRDLGALGLPHDVTDQLSAILRAGAA